MSEPARTLDSVTSIKMVPIESIIVGVRRRIKAKPSAKLIASIRKRGVMQPILLRNNELVFGERRLRACEKLGHEVIPARVLGAFDITDEELRAMEIEENETRDDFDDYEMSAARFREMKKEQAEAEAEAKAAPAETKVGKDGRSRKVKKKAGRQAVSERTGLTPAQQVKIETHVATVEKFSTLAKWGRRQVLDFAAALKGIPSPSQRLLRTLLKGQERPDYDQVLAIAKALLVIPDDHHETLLAQEWDVVARTCRHAPPAQPDGYGNLLTAYRLVEALKKGAARIQGLSGPITGTLGRLEDALQAMTDHQNRLIDRWMQGRASAPLK